MNFDTWLMNMSDNSKENPVHTVQCATPLEPLDKI